MCSLGQPDFATLVDPAAIVMPEHVSIGKGSIVCAETICTVEISIGDHVIINLNFAVGHETTIESFATIAPMAAISGNVRIGKRQKLARQHRFVRAWWSMMVPWSAWVVSWPRMSKPIPWFSAARQNLSRPLVSDLLNKFDEYKLNIFVVGTGTMGKGIVQILAQSEHVASVTWKGFVTN